jgi:mono/diheme cytochrome c family protein
VKVVVAVVQIFAVLCAAAFVVLLFANEPERIDPQAASEAPEGEVVAVDAAAVFADRCSGCHGPDGGGGRGPQLSDGRVAAAYPDIEDQIVVVTEGRDGMPSFADRLTEDEIRAVVAFSRTL